MDKADSSTQADRTQAGSDSSTSLPFKGHDLLLSPDLYSAAAGATVNAAQHLPGLDLVAFKDRAEDFLARVVRNQGDYFNRADLANLVNDPSIKGEDAVSLATLYALSINPMIPSDDHTLEPWGISSVKDIAGIPTSDQGLAKQRSDFNLLVDATDHTNFEKADGNKDGVLSPQEIKQAPVYAKLLEELPDLASSGQGLTLSTLDRALQRSSAQFSLASSAPFLANRAQQHLDLSTTRSLYADQANPLNSIKMEDIHQGETGDCYFLADLADAARQDPAIIRDAIKTNPDGTYTVTFKGDPQHPVTVSAPTDTELALYNGGSADGLWPAVMEKAFASYGQTSERRFADITNEDAIAGGNPDVVIQLLTGHAVDDLRYAGAQGDAMIGPTPAIHTDYSEPAPQTAKMISQALANGRLVTLATDTGDDLAPAGLDTKHCYSIIGLESGTNGVDVLMRNPWETGGQDGQGTIKMSLESLSKLPVSIDVESNQVAPQPAAMQKLATG